MPNLENLKKQAKQYLRWHRERYFPVAAQIRAALPRFRHLHDAQILESSFQLADAQELVARQLGFDGWQALKSGADAMKNPKGTSKSNAESEATSDTKSRGKSDVKSVPTSATKSGASQKTTPHQILTAIEAQLFVANVKTSCDFYTAKLGFEIAFIYGAPPFYAQVVRDNARIDFRFVGEPVFAADVRKRENLLSATVTVATTKDIKQLFLDYQAAGVQLHQPLKKEPWGARTFVISDPDENLILFAGPATD